MRVRTCVVSRSRLPIDQLLRLGIDDQGSLVVRAPGPGRSAWVLPELRHLQRLAAKPGMLRRSLRKAPSTTEHLLDSVAEHLAERLARSLRLAWRSGSVRRLEHVRAVPVATLLAWSDGPVEEEGVRLPWDADSLGCLLRQPRIQALVAVPSRPTRSMLYDLRRWQGLGYSPAPLAVPSPL